MRLLAPKKAREPESPRAREPESSRTGEPETVLGGLFNFSGPRVNCGARGVGRTDRDDVKTEDLLLNISRETEPETKILRVVANLVETILAKFAGSVGKKEEG